MDKENKTEEFEKLVRPLMEYLGKNHNPHTSINITQVDAELSEGKIVFSTFEYILD